VKLNEIHDALNDIVRLETKWYLRCTKRYREGETK